MNKGIVVDGVKITPEIVQGIKLLTDESSLIEMKDTISRILFMLAKNENARENIHFEEGVFLLNVLYDMADSIFEKEGGS